MGYMAVATLPGVLRRVRRWGQDLWAFYRQYTQTAVHAAAVAALTIFGLLVFIDPLFAGVAIAAYFCPPLVLYLFGVDVGADGEDTGATDRQPRAATVETDTPPAIAGSRSTTNSDLDLEDRDTDTDSDSGDANSDGGNGDSDTDSNT